MWREHIDSTVGMLQGVAGMWREKRGVYCTAGKIWRELIVVQCKCGGDVAGCGGVWRESTLLQRKYGGTLSQCSTKCCEMWREPVERHGRERDGRQNQCLEPVKLYVILLT